MQRGATWLGTKLQTAAGRALTYKQGQRSITITVFPLEQQSDVVGKDGLKTSIVWEDFGIVAAELVFNDQVFRPEEGDRLCDTIDGVDYEWMVMPIEKMKHWDWLDKSKVSTGVMIRVRTKRIKNG